MRYTLRTAPAWRTALERLRALAQLLERADVPLAASLDGLAPGQRRTLRDYRTALAGIAWSCAPARLREGLPPERGDLDGWARAGIVDAIASRPCGRLDDDPDARAYQLGHASAIAALYCRPTPAPRERPMTKPKELPTNMHEEPTQALDLSHATAAIVEAGGDWGKVNAAVRVALYRQICEAHGMDPLVRPIDLLKDRSQRLVPYVNKAGAAQLVDRRKLSVEIRSRSTEDIGDGWRLLIVEARATDPTGRACDEIGVVEIGAAAKAADYANAWMKARTKAGRRAVLGLVGIGLLDETEVIDAGLPRVSLDIDSGAIETTAIESPKPTPSKPATSPKPATPLAKPPEDEARFVKHDLEKLCAVTYEKPSEAWARLAIDAGHPGATLRGADPVVLAHVRARLDAEIAAVKSEPVRSIVADAFAILRARLARDPEDGTTLAELLDETEVAHLPTLITKASLAARLASLRADEVQP